MTTYRVQRMTNRDFNNYMSGSWNYSIENLNIEAETAEEAVRLAKKDGYTVNEKSVKTLAEVEAEERAKTERLEAYKRAEAEKKAKKAETEARKAREAGLTVEEYRKAKALKAKRAKLAREIAELEATLEAKRAELEAIK